MEVPLPIYRLWPTTKGPNGLFVIYLYLMLKETWESITASQYKSWRQIKKKSHAGFLLLPATFTAVRLVLQAATLMFLYRGSHNFPQWQQLVGWGKALSFLCKTSYWMPTTSHYLNLRLLSMKPPNFYSYQLWWPRVSHLCSHLC